MKAFWLKFCGFLAIAALCSVNVVAASSDATPAATPVDISSIDPANFVAEITNPYFPLKPGTEFIYEGTSEDSKLRDEVTVTSDTKEILGVTCVVVHDVVFEDGEMVEATDDWYAQDKDGNVWYLGEDSKTYENGEVKSTEGSWEAGKDGAVPGIIMPAHPNVGDVYFQEYYKGEAEDQAQVQSLTDSLTVKYGSYDHVLTTKEWSSLEPETIELKYYAKGVGLLREETVKGESEKDELVEIKTVS
jgi:hypothetical protein